MSSQILTVSPKHLVAVAESDANTILFQVDENYKLIFYESQSPSEGLKKKYDLNTLYVDDDEIKVNEKLPVIAAVAFKHADSCQGQPQVKLTSYPTIRPLLTLSSGSTLLRQAQRSHPPRGLPPWWPRRRMEAWKVLQSQGILYR